MAKHFMNDRKNYIHETIEGLVKSNSERLSRLEGSNSIKVVFRRDWNKEVEGKSNVAIISGGGSGHEPAHAGFVGKGMLTAAVCGEIFSSPSVEAILTAIRTVCGEAGCLLIVKNYTGDRINFGQAAEKAKILYGLKVEMIIVGDDVSLLHLNNRPRGIAGTLLVHKIAGTAAAQGYSLEKVLEISQMCSSNLFSIGVSLSSCNNPGTSTPCERIKYNNMEVGLGIHGEPGSRIVALEASGKIVNDLIDILIESMKGKGYEGKDIKIAVLLNNLGSTSISEMLIVTNDILSNEFVKAHAVYFIGPITAVTALDMHGFSISFLLLDSFLEALLLDKPDVPVWLSPSRITKTTHLPVPCVFQSIIPESSCKDIVAQSAIKRICLALMQAENELNGLDIKIGDGDTGTTFSKVCGYIMTKIDALPLESPKKTCFALSEILSLEMGGSSGGLLSIFFMAASNKMSIDSSWYSTDAWMAGVSAMMKYGGAKLGDRTMLDSLIPAIEGLKIDIETAAKEAKMGAEKTKTMKISNAGRSSYVPVEYLDGIVDPGARAVDIFFNSLLKKSDQ